MNTRFIFFNFLILTSTSAFLGCQKVASVQSPVNGVEKAILLAHARHPNYPFDIYHDGFLSGVKMIDNAKLAKIKPSYPKLSGEQNQRLVSAIDGSGFWEVPSVEIDRSTGFVVKRLGMATAFTVSEVDGFEWALHNEDLKNLLNPRTDPVVPTQVDPWPSGDVLNLHDGETSVVLFWKEDVLVWEVVWSGFPPVRRWRHVNSGWKPLGVKLVADESVLWVLNNFGLIGLDMENGSVRAVAPPIPGVVSDEEAQSLESTAVRKRAEFGDAKAMVELALSNPAMRLAWLEKAAALQEPSALYELGIVYTQGQFVTKDWDRGVAYLERASALGHPGAKEIITAIKAGLFTPSSVH